nr:hypothetical protein [Tanacetum cinerariifolium]
NLVRGLPSKCFENDHTCVACLKGKQHKASCTNSTNFSGTKDAASQEVKKDVSSLRYIALLNWFHEAHLEYSSSNAQDACKADAPESSGNSNPTATLTNPPADQMETLTVETPIPTVSSPVPTACLDDSLQLSSDTRLISKRVISQDDTPSLDNILTLSNRFEDILGVTTNTVYQMDMKSAFLYDTIDEEVYVMQPPGFQDPEFPDRVYKLCREFEALMHEKFQMSAMGELNFFLDVRSANTPTDKENPWGKDRTGKDVDLHIYRSMIGSLMYLTASRLDIMFAICACARHQVTPKECHLYAVKSIFRYIKSHPKLGIWYPKDSPFDLVAYSDSDYGGATQDRKSTTGGCQFLGRRLIFWQ